MPNEAVLQQIEIAGGWATASANVPAALNTLQARLRDGYNFVRGIPGYDISDADRLGVLTTYGWVQDEIGNLSDARIEALANQAITATPSISEPAWRYPALSTPSPRLRGEGRGEGSAFPLAIVNANSG